MRAAVAKRATSHAASAGASAKLANSQKAAERAQGTKIVVHKRVGENGQLFGSVTANEIADALVAKGIEVDKRRIELTHPIKSTGTHDVDVRLHREVTAHIQVEVLPLGVETFAPVEAKAEAKAEATAEAEVEG